LEAQFEAFSRPDTGISIVDRGQNPAKSLSGNLTSVKSSLSPAAALGSSGSGQFGHDSGQKLNRHEEANSFMGYDPVNDVTLIIWTSLTISLDGQPTANTIMLKMLDQIYTVSPLQ
jgi:hypothetical protein